MKKNKLRRGADNHVKNRIFFMRKPRSDSVLPSPSAIKKLLDGGKTQIEIAKFFGVSQSSVSQKVKQLTMGDKATPLNGEYFVVSQVANLFSVKPRAVYNWIYDGLLPFVQLSNGEYLINKKDADQFDPPKKTGRPKK